MKLNLQKKNKGFTLIEILLVVGFIALASVGVYTIYSKVQVSNNANAESRNIDLIRSGIKSLYAAQTNYGTITTDVVNAARIIPDNMNGGLTAAGTPITNSFGGAVSVAPVTLGAGGAANNGFRITYNRVPGPVCVKLASAGGAQFDQVSITAVGDVKAFGVNRINVASITTECNKDVGQGVTMTFDSL